MQSLKGISVFYGTERVQNDDGSVNLMGPLTGLEKYSQAEFDARTFDIPALDAVTYTFYMQELAQAAAETEALLNVYFPFGLNYEINPTTGEINMSWQEKPVHSVFDAAMGVWIAKPTACAGCTLAPMRWIWRQFMSRANLSVCRKRSAMQTR